MSSSSSSSSAAGNAAATTPIAASVSKTARDALQAKYSAHRAGFRPVSKNAEQYERALCTMAEYFLLLPPDNNNTNGSSNKNKNSAKQQTPLVNAGYAYRVAAVLRQIQAFVSFHKHHHYYYSCCEEKRRSFDDNNNNNNTGSCNDDRGSGDCSHPAAPAVELQIVLLGAGLDVAGLWSLSLLEDDENDDCGSTGGGSQAVSIHVIEVDTPDVCHAKKDALVQTKLLPVINNNNDCSSQQHTTIKPVPSSSSSQNNNAIVLRGQMLGCRKNENGVGGGSDVTATTATTGKYSRSRYTLVATDLRDIALVERDLDFLIHDDNSSNSAGTTKQQLATPTLVVSELVLAYLGEMACDNLLRWCARHLCGGSVPPEPSPASISSCLVAYEPLGPSGSKNNNTATGAIPGVLEGYKRDYYRQFATRLERGRRSQSRVGQGGNSNHHLEGEGNNKDENDDKCKSRTTVPFDTLGSSCRSFENRIVCSSNSGGGSSSFVFAHVCNAGVAASYAATLRCDGGGNGNNPSSSSNAVVDLKLDKELFDEHAALALHLKSYALACCFTKQSDVLFRRIVCPWTADVFPRRLRNRTMGENNNADIWLTAIEKEDDDQVRQLFTQTYQHLFQEYPSIHKMVKSAVKKKDLAAFSSCTSENENNDHISSIGAHYRSAGGRFIVAVQYEKHKLQHTITEEVSHPHRRVVGCIGVRKCVGATKDKTVWGKHPVTYEIQRLFVDQKIRKSGIGAALLEQVEDFVRGKECSSGGGSSSTNNNGSYRIIATTPRILEEANVFYLSHNFVLEEEVNLKNLLMRTYVKTVTV